MPLITRILLDVAFVDNSSGSSGFVSIKFYLSTDQADYLELAIRDTKKQMREKGYSQEDIIRCKFELIEKDLIDERHMALKSQEAFVYYD